MYESLINKLFLRILMMVGVGRVGKVNDDGVVQEMQIRLGHEEIKDNTPRMAEFGFASNPPLGTDCLALFAKGDRSTGAVIATNHKESRPRNLVSGETQIYDLWGKHMHFTKDGGIIIDAKNTAVTVRNATIVTIEASTEVIMNTPLLKVSGDILDHYETNKNTLHGFREIYNRHTHDGVDTGPANTGDPNEQI